IATYLYFCLWLGPRLMRGRKAYELKYVVAMYDVLQIILNAYIVCEHIKGGWGVGYSFACQPVDYSDSPRAVRMAAAVWWYFMCNMIALLDTIFFILRKKNNQMSFLHLYHHSMMPYEYCCTCTSFALNLHFLNTLSSMVDNDAFMQLGRCKVLSRWTWHFIRAHQFLYSHSNVFLLPNNEFKPQLPEICKVEEAPDGTTNDSVFHTLLTQFTSFIPPMRLSKDNEFYSSYTRGVSRLPTRKTLRAIILVTTKLINRCE
ncbi:hypothetical protein AMK59_859, partial [Oryctes borbonicus]